MPSPQSKDRHGISPEWANLPRRKCADCGKNYKPVRPVMEGQRGFCSANCRKSYHKHGGAYSKLKGTVEQMVERRFAQLEKELRGIVREEIARSIAVRSEAAAASSHQQQAAAR